MNVFPKTVLVRVGQGITKTEKRGLFILEESKETLEMIIGSITRSNSREEAKAIIQHLRHGIKGVLVESDYGVLPKIKGLVPRDNRFLAWQKKLLFGNRGENASG